MKMKLRQTTTTVSVVFMWVTLNYFFPIFSNMAASGGSHYIVINLSLSEFGRGRTVLYENH